MSLGIPAHKAAAIPTDISVSISLFDSIDTVPEHDWLKFIPTHNSLLQPSYLRLLEETQKGEMQFIYALVFDKGKHVGACYFQVVRFSGTNLLPFFPDSTATSMWAKLKNAALHTTKGLVSKVDIKLLVSGNLFITGEQGIYFLPHYTEVEKGYLLARTIDCIFADRKDISTALLPDMYEPSGDFDAAFIQDNYRRHYVEADMSMTLPATWHSFDDYMQSLSSKYRVRAKKILQSSQALIGHEMSAEEIESQIDRFYELYKDVADKADFNIAKFPKSYFVEQKKLSPDLYKVFGYYLDGKLVGFMSLFILPYKTEVHYCGIDYSINKEYSLYQRMLYDIVGYAATNNLRDLHFGRTAPEVKSTIGAIPHHMYGYLKNKNPLFNLLVGFFARRLKPREYILRSPFK